MSLCRSYCPDYFSVRDIIATEERISCKFEKTCPGLGYLDASSDSEDLKPGTKLELPLWLAHQLHTVQGSIISVDIPIIYKERYRDILEADACAVVLSKWNQYYYEFGMHLRRLKARDCEKITDILVQTFRNRFRLVMDWAQNSSSDSTLSVQLPRLERDLFLTGKTEKKKLNDWLKAGAGNIVTSQTAVNLRKRKRTDYDLD